MNHLARADSICSTVSWRRRQTAFEPKEFPIIDTIIKPTLKRYIILFLFGLNSGIKSFQWIQIPVNTVKLTYYFDVDNFVINSLSVIFLVVYILLSWPACLAIKKIGLRNAVLFGAFATAAGAIIKCLSCFMGGIYLLTIGHVIVALGEQFVFSIPSRLASVWFPDHQVSSAVSWCIFGNSVGTALGFIVPQVMLESAETKEQIGQGLYYIYLAMAIVCTLAFLADVVLFDEAPKFAPGAARQRQIYQEEAEKEKQLTFFEEMASLCSESVRLLKNRDYTILTFFYGTVIGTFYALTTVLDQMLEPLWPGNDILIGNTGLILIIAGLIGLPLWGRIMDQLHRYKLMNIFLTVATILSYGLFAYIVSYMSSELAIYVGAFLIGLFQSAIIASGLELAVEITYPAPELITSSMMNIQPQLFGTFIIYAGSYIVDQYGQFAANSFFAIVCSISLVLLFNVRETLKRQEAVEFKPETISIRTKENLAERIS